MIERFDKLRGEQRDAHLWLHAGDVIQHPSGVGGKCTVVSVNGYDVIAKTDKGLKVAVINISNWVRLTGEDAQ